MFSDHTPACFEFSSRTNRFAYLRNKGNYMGQIKNIWKDWPEQNKEFLGWRYIFYKTLPDGVPKPL